MKIEFISKNEARSQTLKTIREFIKSNKDKIDALMAREAKGMEKLEKSASASADYERRGITAAKQATDIKAKGGDAGHIPGGYEEGMGQDSDGTLRGERNPDTFAPGSSQKYGMRAYKSEPSMQKDALPDLTKDMGIGAEPPAVSLCMGCGGNNTEPLGNHLGLDHFMCRDCGEVGVTIKEENQAAEQNQAQNAMEAMAQQSLQPMVKGEALTTLGDTATWKPLKPNTPKPHNDREARAMAGLARRKKAQNDADWAAFNAEDTDKSEPNMVKVTPPDISEKTAHEIKDEYPGDKEKAYATMWKIHNQKKKNMKKAAMPMNKPVCKSVENIRQAAGMSGAPKIPTVKAPSIPVTGATAPQKDAFNTGGMNPTTAAAMGKSETLMAKGRDDSFHSGMHRDNMKAAQKKIGSGQSIGHSSFDAMHSAASDAALRGEKNPNSFAPGGTYKSEASDYAADRRDTMKDVQKIVNKRPIETTPKRTAEASEVSRKLDASLRGEANPDSFTAKSEKDPSKKPFNTGAGHGGKPAKEVPNQDVAVESAREGTVPPPEEGGKEVSAPGSGGQIKKTKMAKGEMTPTPLCKVSVLRSRAAQRHADKLAKTKADVAAIQAVQSAVQKAEGIPAAPKAPGASATQAPAKVPAGTAPKASSPQPPTL